MIPVSKLIRLMDQDLRGPSDPSSEELHMSGSLFHKQAVDCTKIYLV
jgi:hypothetical protein